MNQQPHGWSGEKLAAWRCRWSHCVPAHRVSSLASSSQSFRARSRPSLFLLFSLVAYDTPCGHGVSVFLKLQEAETQDRGCCGEIVGVDQAEDSHGLGEWLPWLLEGWWFQKTLTKLLLKGRTWDLNCHFKERDGGVRKISTQSVICGTRSIRVTWELARNTESHPELWICLSTRPPRDFYTP